MTVLLRLIAAFLLLKLTNLAVNVVRFPRLRSSARPDPVGPVSLLIPARDEAGVLPVTLPRFLAQPAEEILLLDDGSTDETADVAERMAAADPRFRRLTGAPAPAGWVGKTWACHQLAAAATGTRLVFCDADVRLETGALAAALAEQDRQRAAVFSVFARQRTGTWGERLVAPVIDDVLLSFLPHPLLAAPVPAAATASGALLAFTRAAYDEVGGFAAVRGELTDDVAMARRVRRLGLRLGLALGGELISTRMYDGYADAVASFGRGVHGTVGGRRWPLPLLGVWHLLAYTLPLLLCRRPAWRALLAATFVERLLVEATTGRRQWGEAALMPLTPVAMLPVLGRAMRREQRWKARAYA